MRATFITLGVILGMALGEKIADWIAEMSANPVCLMVILSIVCVCAILFLKEVRDEEK